MVKDHKVTSTRQLKPGDQVSFNRGVYSHHAVVEEVLSDSKIRVIHFSGENKSNSTVHREEMDCSEDIRKGKMLLHEYDKGESLSPDKVLENARAKLSEGDYNLIRNNCEQFATKCKTGIAESKQVQNVGIIASVVLGGTAALVLVAGLVISALSNGKEEKQKQHN